MLWFRRKKKQNEEQAPPEAAAPAPIEEESPPPAEGGAQATRPRRRRGSRGGRGRGGKPGERATPAAPEAAQSAPERKAGAGERKPGSANRKPGSANGKATEVERKPAERKRAQSRRRIQPKRAPLPAAKRELIVSVDIGEQRVAVLEDDRVAEVYLERPERRSIAGNIYLGVVDNVLPGMEAAFVEIGLEKNGFLYVDEIVVPELEGKRHGKKIQDLIGRGETILVQAVKDPMKTKGARLTTDISLPGRFVVFVPNGEGLGVSRRLPDDERIRLRDALKALEIPSGGVIVRTAAEGASADDVERDLVFLQRLWKSIQARAKEAKAPTLVYQEAELPLRVIRDLFTGDYERALVDHERTFKRIVGYLKKTSPHMVERVVRYREKTPLFQEQGVDAEIRSTLSRRVDLPSGGYLIFDYAEAFTVIDVNTGRFVGSRSKSGARLEDTITKNNLEAVKEVVRQLRLRDIGGIIVIDFIDMANPKNRATVEEALRSELERDRTKTYVVEISPLGLVEMTRQNVTDGPREILTRKCPTCAGDGVVVSEASAAVDAERRLRALASGSRTQAFRVEMNPKVASLVIGPAAERLVEIETQAKRRFFIEPTEGAPVDHFEVVAQGKLENLQPEAPLSEGDEIELKLVEIGLHDPRSAVGKLDGYDVAVAGTAKLVGKKVKARVERVLDGTAFAVWLDAPDTGQAPLTAEAEAEKPTRQPSSRRVKAPDHDVTAVETEADDEPVAVADEPVAVAEEPVAVVEEASESTEDTPDMEKPKKRTRRGTRGGRGRKKKPAPGMAGEEESPEAPPEADTEPEEPKISNVPRAPRIHVPSEDLQPEAGEPEQSAEDGAVGDETPRPRKRTRRGNRGGRGRTPRAEPVETAVSTDGASAADYVPMSEWGDEL